MGDNGVRSAAPGTSPWPPMRSVFHCYIAITLGSTVMLSVAIYHSRTLPVGTGRSVSPLRNDTQYLRIAGCKTGRRGDGAVRVVTKVNYHPAVPQQNLWGHRARARNQKQQGAKLDFVSCFVAEICYESKLLCPRGWSFQTGILIIVFQQWPVQTVLTQAQIGLVCHQNWDINLKSDLWDCFKSNSGVCVSTKAISVIWGHLWDKIVEGHWKHPYIFNDYHHFNW